MGNGGHRIERVKSHRNGRIARVKRAPDEQGEVVTDDLPPLPQNALVLFNWNDDVAELLEGISLLEVHPIYAEHPQKGVVAFTGRLVNQELAQEICDVCYPELCQCPDKWKGPFLLGRVTKGRMVRPVHRTELPMEVPPVPQAA